MKSLKFFLAFILIAVGLTGCTEMMLGTHLLKKATNKPAAYHAPAVNASKRKTGNPYKIMGKMYYPIDSSDGYRTKGIASWYGKEFHGRKTANGELYNMYAMTAAHPTLPLPTYVRVTNLRNGTSIVVRVNDRGPFVRGRAIDLSYRAAVELGMAEAGTSPVLLEALPTDGSVLHVGRHDYVPKKVALVKEQPKRLPRAPAPAPSNGRFTDRISGNMKASIDKNTSLVVETPLFDEGNISSIVVRPEIVEETSLPDDEKELVIGEVQMFVQTGAFTTRDNAEQQASKVEGYYNDVDIYDAPIKGRKFYRVRVGPLANVEIADTVLSRLVSAGFNVARIVVK